MTHISVVVCERLPTVGVDYSSVSYVCMYSYEPTFINQGLTVQESQALFPSHNASVICKVLQTARLVLYQRL